MGTSLLPISIELVGGKSHLTKGFERIKNLQNIINKQNLGFDDFEASRRFIERFTRCFEGSKPIMKWDVLHEKLVEAIPELEKAYKEELEDWDEFPGNHNILGNVLNPFLVELLEQPNKQNLKQRIFAFLELMALSEDVKVQEVLSVTVLERLGDSGEF